MRKILFIHGLASSGEFKTAGALRTLLAPCEVIAPDVPIDPDEALSLLRGICEQQCPDLIVGLSLGGFWAQKLRGYSKILINPEFHVSSFLRERIGTMDYLCPRKDGAKSFEITAEICDRYEALEADEFNNLSSEEIALTHGMFANADELVHCAPEFEIHYPGQGISYPGGHLPGFNEIKNYLVPLDYEISRTKLH